jgi:eukaryotic-like serine/threonine-protein kinase
VTHYPADRVGQNNLASCYVQLRNAPKALAAAKQAVAIVPKGVGQRLNLAFISSFAGDFAASEKEARAALEISPSAAQGYLVLAEAQLGEGQIDKAADSYHQLERFGAVGVSTANAGLADLAAYQGSMQRQRAILTQGATADVAAKNRQRREEVRGAGKHRELQGHMRQRSLTLTRRWRTASLPQIKFLAARAMSMPERG